ncbi:unnamed protein product [Camellia sinensis]
MVRNGGMMMKLPIGFRFHPTDEELVVHYLNRRSTLFHCLPLSFLILMFSRPTLGTCLVIRKRKGISSAKDQKRM